MNRSSLQNNAALAVIALASLFVTATSLQAQNGFRVSQETGLEIESGSKNNEPPKVAEKKAKPAPSTEKKATEITCSGETIFDVKAGMAVFVKEVRIVDPQFTLSADKLTAYLKKAIKPEIKEAVAAAAANPPASNPAPKSDAAPDSPASGLERATAEGNVIISQDKVDEKTGEITHYIGKGAKADYNALTGDMTLSGWPQIQQGSNNQVATEEGTVMIMNKDGHLRTLGRSKTVIQTDAKPAKTEKP